MRKPQQPVEQEFTRALNALVERVKLDRSILAAILCGSLAHDTVWAKSDIDLVLVTIDDRKVPSSDVSLNADGVNVHAFLMPRAAFRKMMEGSLRNSFMHSFLAKGKLIYTHDETLAALCAKLQQIGERDTEIQLLRAATTALPPVYKARKWLLTRGDLDYSALWILNAATPLARIEIMNRRMLADREVIPQALKLNPKFFKLVYSDLLNAKKTEKKVRAALDAVDGYLRDRAEVLFLPVLAHLREAGEARSATEINNYFQRNFDVEAVTVACEYLADEGLITKVSTPVQLTRKSNVQVEELAFVHMGDAPNEF